MKHKYLTIFLIALGLTTPVAQAESCRNALVPGSSGAITAPQYLTDDGNLQAAASEVGRMSFIIKEDGDFVLRHVFDQSPDSRCLVEGYARIAVGDIAGRIRKIFAKRTKKRRFILRASNLPPVDSKRNETPIINIQTRTTCGEDVFTSSVFARYLKCGTGSTTNATNWVLQLRKQLKIRARS